MKKIFLILILLNFQLYAYDDYKEFEDVEPTAKQITKIHRTKLANITKLAKMGDTKSQILLYEIYTFGSELSPPVFSRKFKYLKILANKNLLWAQQELAQLYFMGYTWQLKHDFHKAMYWYKKAAKNGDSKAMIRIGTMYEKGIGVKRNMWEARHWVRKAYKTGDLDAHYFVEKYAKR